MAISHTGDTLFHCWDHTDRQQAFETFESIVRNGLLLTINTGRLDCFRYSSIHGPALIDVMQKARVCFTEIPLEHLNTHQYGEFAVGFSRKILVEWGGCPAWYLPNHPRGPNDKNALKEVCPEMVRGLHATVLAMQCFQEFASNYNLTINFSHGIPLSGNDLQWWLECNKQSLEHVLSCVKEMSHPDIEDFRYLYEREWRIVDGMQVRGTNVCRELSSQEKNRLGGRRPVWMNHVASDDINIHVRHQKQRIIDYFRFFNGVDQPISQKIDTVLVPDGMMAAKVERFIRENQSNFGEPGPTIQLFPGLT